MKMEIQNNIHESTKIGDNPKIEEYVIIKKDTTIGNNPTIRSHTVIYHNNIIGNDFQTGHNVNIRENNKIGNNVSIGTKTTVEHNITIEDDVRIHSNAFIPEFSILRKGCWIGPCATLTNARYPKSEFTKNNLEGVEIKENAKIGANATILPGITIGKNSIVGAGSVVTKDIPDNIVVAGNPAKEIKKVDELNYKEGKAYE
jgi:acetyltransferase-like isoleucine patch superfamily enzyme